MDTESGCDSSGDGRLRQHCPSRAARWHNASVCHSRRAGSQTVGCTRFCAIDHTHRRVEIGWTWIGRRWQRSGVNKETKLLMLRHAFETLRYIRVELKTDALNNQSRQVILRIGVTEEGVFRKHIIPGRRSHNQNPKDVL